MIIGPETGPRAAYAINSPGRESRKIRREGWR